MRTAVILSIIGLLGYFAFNEPDPMAGSDAWVINAGGAGSQGSFEFRGYTIQPLQDFALTARVLSQKEYGSDREAQLSPVDLALGWGPMADFKIIQDIKVSQSNRWYHWKVDQFPIPRREIETNSANMHMIPATREIEAKLKQARQGDRVKLSGKLIEARSPDGWKWRSSLTRQDTGAHACEVIWVESFDVIG